ncbi:Ionotropic glutamate receptor L-glutamate and glycine-binding domain [Trinorchestia longiramus]|nr:Ionotropic glutamate receptor L-glutamate and glycine-binding domain [Trinorchestia longiramus]
MQGRWSRLSPWLIVCNPHLLQEAFTILPWPLDNKVQLLVPEELEISAWEAYRAAASVPTVYERLSTISLPPRQEELEIMRREPWSRRTNLTGLIVRCSVLKWSPYTIPKKTSSDELEYTGMSHMLITTLQDHLHFKLVCNEPKDRQWGTLNVSSGSWSGILGELQRGESDICTAPYSFTYDRARFFEFSIPAEFSKQIILHQTPTPLSNASGYTKQFSVAGWLSIAALFVASVCILKKVSSGRLSWPDSTMENARIFCNMGYGTHEPRLLSQRLWLLGSLCTVVLLHVYYTAFLTAALSSDVRKLPVRDLNDIYAKREEYTLGLIKESALSADFELGKDPLMAKLWKDIVSKDPKNLADFDYQVSRTLNDSKHVFMSHYTYYVTSPYKSCKLTILPVSYFKRGLHFPLRRNFSATPLLNYGLQKMIEGGIRAYIWSKWIDSKQEQCTSGGSEPLGLEETHTGFFPLVGGAGMACIFLIMEKAYNRHAKKSLKNASRRSKKSWIE